MVLVSDGIEQTTVRNQQMNQPQLTELERRAYRTVVDDGLLDIGLGVFFLGFFVSGYVPVFGVPSLVFLLAVVGWVLARRRLIEPRVGRVQLNAERRARIAAGRLWVTVLFTVPTLVAVVWLYSRGAVLGTTETGTNGYGSLVVALSLGTALLVGATLLDLQRFWLYAATLMAAGIFQHFAGEPFDEFKWAVASTVTLIGGAVVLARFLERFPRPGDG